MVITIISIGTQSKPEIKSIIQSFTKRLPKQIRVDWRYIKHGGNDLTSSIKKETESILSALPKKNKIILLDETGEQFTSPQLSKILLSDSTDITIIIGGAYGIGDEVKVNADIIWSLGLLVYPHQLVRLILSEQIYRAHCIDVGHPYHHE